MKNLLFAIFVGVFVAAAAASLCADEKDEKVLYDQKFKLMDLRENREVGTFHLRAVEKGKEIRVTEQVSGLEYRGKKAGWKTLVTYKTQPVLAPSVVEGETYIDGKVCMKGKLTFSKDKADISVTGVTDKRGSPYPQPRKMEKKGIDIPKGVLVFPRHLRVLGPKILPKAGELKDILRVDFPDDIDFPEFINWHEGNKLVRENAKDGSFTVMLGTVGGGIEAFDINLKFDSKGKYLPGLSSPGKWIEVPVEKTAEQQILKDLEARLKKMLKELCPDAEVKIENEELIAQHKTKKFQVHWRNKTGVSEKTHEEVGPEETGFLLRLRANKGSPRGQAVSGQILKEEHWQTLLVGYALEWKEDIYIWLRYSYGSKTDAKLLDTIKTTIAGYAKKSK